MIPENYKDIARLHKECKLRNQAYSESYKDKGNNWLIMQIIGWQENMLKMHTLQSLYFKNIEIDCFALLMKSPAKAIFHAFTVGMKDLCMEPMGTEFVCGLAESSKMIYEFLGNEAAREITIMNKCIPNAFSINFLLYTNWLSTQKRFSSNRLSTKRRLAEENLERKRTRRVGTPGL